MTDAKATRPRVSPTSSTLRPSTPRTLSRHDDPDLGFWVPPSALVVTRHRLDDKPYAAQSPGHLPDREGAKHQREAVDRLRVGALLDELLVKDRQPSGPVLPDRLDEGDPGRAPWSTSPQADTTIVLAPSQELRNM